jgi:hypothetical protein
VPALTLPPLDELLDPEPLEVPEPAPLELLELLPLELLELAPLELLELLELPELVLPEELEAFEPTVPLDPASVELPVGALEFDTLELLPSPQAESASAATQTVASEVAR